MVGSRWGTALGGPAFSAAVFVGFMVKFGLTGFELAVVCAVFLFPVWVLGGYCIDSVIELRRGMAEFRGLAFDSIQRRRGGPGPSDFDPDVGLDGDGPFGPVPVPPGP